MVMLFLCHTARRGVEDAFPILASGRQHRRSLKPARPSWQLESPYACVFYVLVNFLILSSIPFIFSSPRGPRSGSQTCLNLVDNIRPRILRGSLYIHPPSAASISPARATSVAVCKSISAYLWSSASVTPWLQQAHRLSLAFPVSPTRGTCSFFLAFAHPLDEVPIVFAHFCILSQPDPLARLLLVEFCIFR